MISHWISNYVELLWTSKIVTQMSCFLLVMISFMSLGELLYALTRFVPDGFLGENQFNITVGVFFHLLIAVIFFSRFCVLWRVSRRRVWYSQILWISGVLTIYSYIIATRGSLFENPDDPFANCMDCFYLSTFRYASATFTVIFLFYLWISVLKEVAFGIIAFSQVISKKD